MKCVIPGHSPVIVICMCGGRTTVEEGLIQALSTGSCFGFFCVITKRK